MCIRDSCYIATREKKILGFACYDVTARGFLGPMAVSYTHLPAGVGLYWVASAVVRSIQQVLVNKHIDKTDFDQLIEKNKDKAKNCLLYTSRCV